MPVKDFWRFYVVYPWDLTRRELDEMATEVIDGKEQELANELFAEITHDENDNAVEYTISYVNECNTNDEPVSKPVISYPTYDLPDDWMAVENQKIRAQANEKEKNLDVKMIEEPQTLQNEEGDGQCARSYRTKFEDEPMEIDTLCASEMKINSEILTAFTCLAVYDMATPTTLPPVSSSSPVNGGGVLTIIRLKQHTSNNESRACAGCRERRWGCPERI